MKKVANKGNRKKILVTHSGRFHADDVFATAFLKILLKDNLTVLRTRDEKKISKGDWVVDIGGLYNVRKNRFDHHQEGGAGKRKNGVPYSSFGLVWKKYGKDVCGSKKVADEIEEKLVQVIDAYDNGFEIVKPVKDFLPYTIADVISSFNPTWDEKRDQNKSFKEAVDLAKNILQREILKTKSKIKAEKIVERFYKGSHDKRVIVLSRYYPWERVIMKYQKPRFVIYPQDNIWSVRTVKKSNLSMENRKSFPKSWGGKMKDDLAKLSGVKDAIFCHNKLFIATASSKEGAISLAKKALQMRS